MKYRDFVFDLYGTLVDIHTDETSLDVWEKTAEEFARHGADYGPGELRAAWSHLVKEAESDDSLPLRQDAHEAHPEIQIERVFKGLFEKKGIQVDLPTAICTAQAFRRHSTRYIRLYDGAFELLSALRQHGGRVWLLSNAQACFTWMELEELGLLPLFDGVCLSSDFGCKKPDKRFFDILLGMYHIAPEYAVMVGNDGVCDIQGARAAGLATLYIRSNISPDEPMPDADYILKEMDLSKVKDVLLNQE